MPTMINPSAKWNGQPIYFDVRSDGTTYVEHNPDRAILTPRCRKCPDWLGATLTYDPADPMGIRSALLYTNRDTVWHRVEHDGPIPVRMGTAQPPHAH
jgi:hypothetical protein